MIAGALNAGVVMAECLYVKKDAIQVNKTDDTSPYQLLHISPPPPPPPPPNLTIFSNVVSPTGELQPFKWENALSVDSRSWGHRRGVDLRDFLSIESLIKELVTTVRYVIFTLQNSGYFPVLCAYPPLSCITPPPLLGPPSH